MEGARNIRLLIEYDGTAYGGWQTQDNAPTVQEAIERALGRLTGARPRLRAAGRTDAGVHATGQVASFQTASAIPLRGVLLGTNALLPRDIAILRAEEAPADFDARRSARGKRYRYSIWNRLIRSPLQARTTWHLRAPLDAAAMAAAAQALVGRHDFRAFRAADCERRTTVRELTRVAIARTGDLVVIEVEGTAFLKNMVRIIAGTLVAVGRGRLDRAGVEAILRAGDRTRAGMTAPPQGLELAEVFY